MGARFEFRLLGPLEIARDGELVPLGSPKLRVLLASLLVDANRVVPMDVLVERLWGESASGRGAGRARDTVQTYMQRLRQSLGAPEIIVTRSDGYLIDAPGDALDLRRFEGLARRGKSLLDQGNADEASQVLSAALDLWRGDPLAGVPSDALHRELVPALVEHRLATLENRIEADVLRGLHSALVGELLVLTQQHPLRERLWGQLMLAYYHSGQQAEALRTYQTVRTLLASELGVDPSAQLQQVHHQILRADPALAAVSTPAAPSARLVPRQLPAHTPHFVGRGQELEHLSKLAHDASTVTISAIVGTAGVGKTTLAVHWSHQVADRFPDGQLYVNLHGFDPSSEPTAPGEAIRGFLSALDVPPDRVPLSPDAQAALYRSLLVGRKVLVLLDNARDSDQVRPLLPGTSSCHVMITSRNLLTSLVAHEGARSLSLDTPGVDEARALVAEHLGHDRVAADPTAVDDLITWCARLPLALAIMSARAAHNHGLSLRVLADDLGDDTALLDALDTGDSVTSVRGVFWWSYRHLGEQAARMFRLLGVHPGPDISWRASASLAGLPGDEARAALAELTTAHLLTEHRPGRFAFHDLLRAYAVELAGPKEREDALPRLFDHYTRTAVAASAALQPLRDGITLDEPVSGVEPEQLSSHAEAWSWFEDEEPVLSAVARLARDTGFHVHAWQLPWALAVYLGRTSRWQELTEQQHTALPSAEALGDLDAQGRIHHMIGHARSELLELDKAEHHLLAAMELYRRLGDGPGEARAHRGLGFLFDRLTRWDEAVSHGRAAVALFEASGHLGGLASALNAVGFYLSRLGRYQDAVSHCERALTLHRRLDDRQGEAYTLDSIGVIHHHLGDHQRAIDAYQRSADLLEELGDHFEHASTLDRLGDTYLAAGQVAAAHRVWERAAALFDDLRHQGADAVRNKLVASGRQGVIQGRPR
ncbi:BTAD domain-containing putative transcriptional regulator [Lentzea sp. NPDC051213]|uniref:AfsR/SARP family transcriptional regulator n=1 Tax=Lentzea sp. NPDC051213 TaxID=3364126 RepID=UPI00379F4CDE